jgi:hypothetical protein
MLHWLHAHAVLKSAFVLCFAIFAALYQYRHRARRSD